MAANAQVCHQPAIGLHPPGTVLEILSTPARGGRHLRHLRPVCKQHKRRRPNRGKGKRADNGTAR